MAKKLEDRLNESLKGVMHRFREFFIGPGMNIEPDKVPLRHRDDFAAPLVTLRGYTYGVRLVGEAGSGKGKKPRLAVEVSANVYSDEFDVERFKRRLLEDYRPENVERPMRNFMTKKDEALVGKEGPLRLASFFEFDLDRDLEIAEKKKETASEVTGELRDMILRLRYWIRPEKLETFSKKPELFATAVYLYCLRVFVLAYHQTLSAEEQRLPFRGGRGG